MAKPLYHGASPGDADVLCIVVHGRTQTQADMMSSIVERVPLARVRYALPKSDDVGWYAARAIDPLTDQTTREMDTGLAHITELIAQARAETPDCPLLLCGFSQGACMAIELLMRQPAIADAVCLLTGCRVGSETDTLPLSQVSGLAVYASCGDADPWIPQEAYHRMLGDLTRVGARLRTDMFPGRPHEITDTEIAVLAGMLNDLVQKRALLEGMA